jgi:Tol biopolymer transport system component
MMAVGVHGGGSVSSEAARAQLDRILASAGFRYSERLCRFLKFVVEQQLAGNASQLKESVLAVEIFDRESTYDSRVDSVVRVEARRLREKLNKYYSGEGREDPVIIELPKGSYAPLISLRGAASAGAPAESPAPAVRVPRKLTVRTVIVAAVFCVLATFALTRWIGSRAPSRAPALQRLTSDSGLTFQPALSADGKLLAYSSDRSGRGDLDIWLQQVPGGVPVRLTDNPADDIEPAFSPDGTMVAYRAEGNASGVYIVPSLGGKSTLLAEGGYRPRFSPDGARVAYWTGERGYGTAKVFIVPSAGGSPLQVQPDFAYAAFPVWSPDGRYVAFVASTNLLRNDWNADDWDWWVAPADGGPAVRTSAQKVFKKQRLQPPQTGWSHRRIIPYSWSSSGRLVFSARLGDQTNIWQIPISARTLQVTGPAEQLTFGAGRQDQPSMAGDGALVFSALTHKSDVWSLPIDPNAAEPLGPTVRLTSGPTNYIGPIVSRDGGRLAFISNRSGNEDVWVRDVKTGREIALTATRADKSAAVLSPDGSKVAVGYAPELSIFVVPSDGGKASQLCADCGQPRAWLPNGAGLLYQWMSRAGDSLIGVLDQSGRAAPLVRSSKSALFSPSISQDGRFVALIVRTPPNDHCVTVVPLRGGSAAPETDWIPVTESGSWVDKPRWSPDGNILYYVSDRDGFVCIWARRLDPATKKPAGEPKAVVHFHNVRNSLGTVYGLELSVARDKLVFNLAEGSGNVWLAPASQ